MLCDQCAGCALTASSAAAGSGECGGGIIAAGMVCASDACGVYNAPSANGSGLARMSFAIQEYKEGFCPCEAFEQGTMFPELVQ